MSIPYAQTQYGFRYGSVEVTRCCSDEKKGWVVLMAETPKFIVQIYATKTGKVRVFEMPKEAKK